MVKKVSVSDLSESLVGKYSMSQAEAEAFVSVMFDVINDGLHNDKSVKVKGLGTFKVIDVRERESVNVNTGERVVIESHGKLTFTPDPIMRDLVNKPFAQFETVALNDGVDLEDMSKVSVPEDDETDMPQRANVEEYEQKSCGGQLSGNRMLVTDNVLDAEKEQTDIDEVNHVEQEQVEDKDSSPESQEVHIAPSCKTTDGTSQDFVYVEREEIPIERNEVISSQHNDEFQQDAIENNEWSMENKVVDENDDISEQTHSRRMYIWFVLIVLFVGVGAYFAGFYYGRNSVVPIVKIKPVSTVKQRLVSSEVRDTVHENKNVSATNVEKQNKKDTTISVPDAKQPEVDKDVKALTAPQSQSLKDATAIVNTGAYRIIGTATTIVVKKGETLDKISRFYLGDGMKCYIQVHNGITEVKEGMKIKIPKLQLKKIKNKR